MTALDDPNELRLVIRRVLQEVLPSVLSDASSGSRPAPDETPVTDTVSIRDDVDLDAFVRRMLAMLDDPTTLADLRAGRRRFRLDRGAAGQARPRRDFTRSEDGSGSFVPDAPSAEARDGVLVERRPDGVVTESQVVAIARERTSLLLGPRAVITPLARDRARQLGLTVEREP